MNELVGSPRIGQWYLRGDKGETFLVTGRDQRAGTIEIQSLEGDLDEIDDNNWSALPLEFAEPPEDSSGTMDSPPDDTGSEEAAMPAAEALEDLELEPLGKGLGTEEPLPDEVEVEPRSR